MKDFEAPNQEDIYRQYPMGPKLRQWLNVTDANYFGHLNESPTNEVYAAFQERLIAHMEEAAIANGDMLCDLLEELVGMNLPLLAVRLVDSYPTLFLKDDFRSQLHLGNACLLIGEYLRAEKAFLAAQHLVPAEPAPYVNLVQIYCQDRHLETALRWAKAGLDVDPNFFRLWELLAWIYQQLDFETAKTNIRSEADLRHSWAGASLAADLETTSSHGEIDPNAKLSALEPFYQSGERDYDFLVEYTAALGLAGHYERIPTVIWQVERQASSGLPWQLYLHLVQAYLGLARDEQALEIIDKVSKMSGLPQEIHTQLQALKTEASANTIH